LYSTFAKHVIYPMFQINIKEDTLKHFEQLEKTPWHSVDKIRKIQWKKLRALLEYAYANVPLYHRAFKTPDMIPKDITTPDKYRILPLLGKEGIRNHISRIVSSDCKTRDLRPDSI
jgi:phenylacetate-CoA ligase